MTKYYDDASIAIREANTLAIRDHHIYGVAYCKPDGWVVYNPIHGAPQGSAPEFLCFALGEPPLCLSEEAIEVMNSILRMEIRLNKRALR